MLKRLLALALVATFAVVAAAGTPVNTQGTDWIVKSATLTVAAGTGTTLLAAKPGTVYRVLSVQMSMDANGYAYVYHGTAKAATNVIAGGYMGAYGGSNPTTGDWSLKNAATANQKVCADVSGGNAIIVLIYTEVSTLP